MRKGNRCDSSKEQYGYRLAKIADYAVQRDGGYFCFGSGASVLKRNGRSKPSQALDQSSEKVKITNVNINLGSKVIADVISV